MGDPVNWTRLFPGRDALRSPSPELPPRWNDLLAKNPAEAREGLCELLGVASTSAARSAILAGGELVVLAWARRSMRKDPRMRELAVEIGGKCLLFSPPVQDGSGCARAEQHARILRELGPVNLGAAGGRLLAAQAAMAVSHEVRDLLAEEGPHAPELVVFFDHGTGDFDCWLEDEQDEARLFDHETRELAQVSTGGFSPWFEKRFREAFLTP